QQWLSKLRIEAAMRMLRGEQSIASIGLACGFTDQSAFTRQFKATAGITPRDYRAVVVVNPPRPSADKPAPTPADAAQARGHSG
ncbi:MAG: helix-turn-helix domain-containing protein, partial [Steroidobacteraceae bacterium]